MAVEGPTEDEGSHSADAPKARPSSDDRPFAEPEPGFWKRLKLLVLGAPRNLRDSSLFHTISLIPFLAWVGLGADGLSSSAYGPEEAFRALGEHRYLAVFLAAMTAFTVALISTAYTRIIREFPSGGGGYVVATKLLGEKAGLISGCALLVDYVLTITISIAASGDAIFSFLPADWHALKLPAEALIIVGLTTINMRGVRESVIALAPIFLLFLVTHAIVIGGGVIGHATSIGPTLKATGEGLSHGAESMGIGAVLLLLVHAYSLGGGTYTGIEAVSNGLPIMREPRVRTANRTMFYMAVSLAVTASGLLLCYLLWDVEHVPGKTMNAVLLETMTHELPFGMPFVVATLLSEGALLVVAAQAGFIDGPRVLANMAVDSWMPRRFAALSDRLTTRNGIMLMGAAALTALIATGGDVRFIVVMYSINVFATFSLSMFGMLRNLIRTRRERTRWRRRTALFALGFVLCALILVITVIEKFEAGGWITVVVTGALVTLCFWIRHHYRAVHLAVTRLYSQLAPDAIASETPDAAPDRNANTAVVLVASWGGLGIHTVFNVLRSFPGHFKNMIFVSVGVIDSGEFKGEGAVEALDQRTKESLELYVALAHSLGLAATYRRAIGTEAVATAEKLCLETAREFPRTTFFAGKVIFQRDYWFQRILHNETAYAIQKRLQWDGYTMVILPARVGFTKFA